MKVGFPSNFFKRYWVPPPFYSPPSSTFINVFSLTPSLYWRPLQSSKSSLPLSETFKLLLGCHYGHIIVRRIPTKLIRCAKMFLLLISTRNTKDFVKLLNNLSCYFGNLGTAIFKEHFSVPLSIRKNFYCNLSFHFNYKF